jgi:hypothetical protein
MNSPITETANFNISVTIASSPIGIGYVMVDSIPITTPTTFSWIPGSIHTISANSPVGCGVGCRYVFISWSDGGSQTHQIIPLTSMAYVANFQRQYYLNMTADPTTGGTLTPSNGWYNIGTGFPITATSSESCMFLSWIGAGTGSYTGTSNPSSVTMNGAVNETANFECGTMNTMNFTGYLNYSNGQPVKNSLIKITLRNDTLGYEKSGINQTNQYGYFFVKIPNVPDAVMISNLYISIYVIGNIEAVYDCWYNHTSSMCCSLPLTGPCN